MSTFITLLKFTQQGIENIKDAPGRLDAAKKFARDLGAEIKAFYLVMGKFDALVITEAPNDETAAKMLLTLGSLGNISTETLRAFTEDEYRKIVADLPLADDSP